MRKHDKKIINMRFILSIGILFLVSTVYSQLPKRAQKLEGRWVFDNSSSYEEWRLKGDVLEGESYRVTKLKDTTLTESLMIKRAAGRMVHTIVSHKLSSDTVVENEHTFVGRKRRLIFENISDISPYSIAYHFGFLNRNKLKIKIKYGMNEKPVKFILHRLK